MDKYKNNLEEIVDEQHERLHRLDGATILIKGKHNVKDELERLHNEVSQVSYSIESTRKILERMKEQNAHFKKLSSLIEALDKKIMHQEKNVPPEVIQGYLNAYKQECTQTSRSSDMLEYTNSIERKTPKNAYTNIEKQETVKDCKRTLFSEPEICLTMPFLSVEEFSKIPKYIIGRQTLETINSLISAINQTLLAKYMILSAGKAAAQKKGDINLYLQYKKQEFDVHDENGYHYFFTAEDYYRQTKTKLDKTKLNLITALRHCKRLRECRIKNNLRYVITPH